jgi:ribosome-binding protein aMBF1 (putative translation factor)
MIQEKQHYREQSDRVRKAENETEDFHVKKVEMSFSQQLIQYRTQKKWKRQDLARFLCMKENDIGALETGKAVYDGQLIHRIKQKLKL